jgi:soluble P-type ATPase
LLTIEIPGAPTLELAHLVLDYNGTLAVDGELLDGVAGRLTQLSEQLEVHVVTADTFGKVQSRLRGLPCRITVLPQGDQAQAKLDYIQELGPGQTACMGNGRNDRLMLRHAVLGIALIQGEGAASVTLAAADVVCGDAVTALDLLLNPLRLAATLRV